MTLRNRTTGAHQRKWLIATPSLPPAVAGPAQYAAGIGGELERRGEEVRTVAYGALEHALPPLVRHKVYALRLASSALRSDIVFALDTWSVGVPALLVARIFRKKYLVRVGGDFLWESYVERTGEKVPLSEFYQNIRPLSLKEKLIRKGTGYLLSRADAILFTTTWQRDLWQKAYRFDDARAHVLENVFPPRETPSAPAHRTFVAAGRAIRLKNMETLRSAFRTVQERHPDIALDERQLPPAEHLARIARCYAVIVPSLSEVNPNTLVDAIRFGKPFIATRDTGALARLGTIGVFVDTRDEASLERAIESLLDPRLYEETASRIRAFTYVRTWDDIADDVARIANHL